MGQRGFTHRNLRQGWLRNVESHNNFEDSYRRRFYQVAHDVASSSIAGVLHRTGGLLHGKNMQIVLSVTGGANDHFNQMSEDVSNGFEKDIVRTAETFHGLVVSGGTSSGVMKCVGKALQQHTRVDGSEVACIGIAAASRVLAASSSRMETQEEVVFTDADLRRANYSASMTHCTPPELRGHQGFVLVETNTRDDAFRNDQAAALFRAKLERSYAEMHRIPLALIVVGGGPMTLKTVQSAVQSNENVFIIRGSGGIAHAIVQLYEAVASDDANLRASVQKDLGNVEYLKEYVGAITQVCYSAKRANNLHIIDYKQGSSCCQILLQQAMVAALGRRGRRTDAEHGFAESWRQYIEQLVRDKHLRFLKETLQVVFHDLAANASAQMGPDREKLNVEHQLDFMKKVALCALRADLSTMNVRNAQVVSFCSCAIH
jgi:hypothetical protein